MAIGTAPGRAVVVGEHTDYAKGLVLAFAIDRRVVAAVGPAPAGYVVAGAGDLPVVRAGALEPRTAPAERWANLPLGVLHALTERGWAVPPCRIQLAADLPRGAGVSSSAAVTVATLVAVLRWLGLRLSAPSAADVCWRAERDFAGVPCGPVDPIVVVSARRGRGLLVDCETLASRPVRLTTPGAAWYLVASGVRHDVGGAGYRARRREWDRIATLLAAQRLDCRRLAPADVAGLARRWRAPLGQRLAHVVGENDRVTRAVEAAAVGATTALGGLLDATQASLRDRYQVGDPTTDRLTARLAALPRTLGARVVGAGFGGSILVLAALDPTRAVAAGLRAEALAVLGRPASVQRIRPSAGAGQLAADVIR